MSSNAELIAQVAALQEKLRRLEAELAASRRMEKHFRLASELASDYAFVRQVTRDGKDRLVWLNRSIFEVMGYAEGEQESEDQLFGSIHPDDLAQVQAALLQVLQGQEAASENPCRPPLRRSTLPGHE